MRCSGVMSLNGVSLKRRMSSCAQALPAIKAKPAISAAAVRIFIWCFLPLGSCIRQSMAAV
jgi:hypothetical protein